jgi:adenosylhomocysteine nucleosidase
MSGTVVVVTAMREEAHRLGATMRAVDSISPPRLEGWEGRIGNTDVHLFVTGIGKVASALATQNLIDRYNPQWLLVMGVAGAVREEFPVGSLTVPSRAVQWDVGARPLLDRSGLIPGFGSEYFWADTSLTDAAKRACENRSGVEPLDGTALTGDVLVASTQKRDQLQRRCPDAVYIDMETAAAAHVASANGVPWVAIRMLSDLADDALDATQVLKYTSEWAASELAAISRQLITIVSGMRRPEIVTPRSESPPAVT